MIQGIRKEKIFKENYLKGTFVSYLEDASNKNNVRVIAYCIMDNHAHILIYINEIQNLSKMMHSLNTRYAIKYNKYKERCGFVFRNRYRCENILNITYLKNYLK
jgi:REP element-mobilizing transposase RayT